MIVGTIYLKLTLARQIEELVPKSEPCEFGPARDTITRKEKWFGFERIKIFVNDVTAVDWRSIV